jgi:hypothetical protein
MANVLFPTMAIIYRNVPYETPVRFTLLLPAIMASRQL